MTSWEHELAGYIWGEGTIGVFAYNTRRKIGGEWKKVTYFRPTIKITARLDDIEILKDIKNKLGGYLYIRNKNYIQKGGYVSKPSAYWSLQDIASCKKILNILENANFPSKKKKILPLFREFLYIRRRRKNGVYRGRRYGTEKRLRIMEIIEEMKKMRSYNEE